MSCRQHGKGSLWAIWWCVGRRGRVLRFRAAARPTKADASIRSRMIMPVGVESSWKVRLRLRPAVYRPPDLQHGPQNPERLYSPLKKLKKSQPGGRRLEKRWDTSSKHTSWSALEKSSGAFLFSGAAKRRGHLRPPASKKSPSP